MFERPRLLVERYYCALLKQGTSRSVEHLLHEVRARLRSLEWLHARLVEIDGQLEAERRSQLPADRPAPATVKLVFTDTERPDCERHRHAALPFQRSDELRVLLEAFYYSAHRVGDIFKAGRRELRGLPRFDAVGVRNVRNHLVEHPSGPSGVLVFSVAAGGPVGPQMKPVRWSLDAPGSTDPGLHKNAAEFEAALTRVLERAIEVVEGQT